MSDIHAATAAHVGREVTAQALGKTWTFARWTRRVWSAIARYAKNHLPDPIAEVNKTIDAMTLKEAEVVRELVRRDADSKIKMAPQYTSFVDRFVDGALAKAGSCLAIGSPELNSFIRSIDGAAYALYLLLKDAHPEEMAGSVDKPTDAALDLCWDILQDLGPQEYTRITMETQGTAPKNAEKPALQSAQKE